MSRFALSLTFVLLGFAASHASAAEVARAYKGVVTSARGPHASSFIAGQEINFRYVLETTIPDANPSVSTGLFRDGLRELRISIPGASAEVVTGPGNITTFDDVRSTLNGVQFDQASFYSLTTNGQLAGFPVTYAEVDFFDYAVGVDGKVVMISSDAIPETHLVGSITQLLFETSTGTTVVYTLAEADAKFPLDCATPTRLGDNSAICTASAVEEGIVEALDDGSISSAVARLLLDSLTPIQTKLAWIAANPSSPDLARVKNETCSSINAFNTRMDHWVRLRRLPAHLRDEWKADMLEVKTELGCR